LRPPERRKGSRRKQRGQQGHPGGSAELLPIEQVDEMVEPQPDDCRRCGQLLQDADSEPPAPSGDQDPADNTAGDRAQSATGLSKLLHQHLRCPVGGCGSQSLRAPAQCPGRSAGQCLPSAFQQDQGASSSVAGCGDPTIRQHLSAALERPVEQAIAFARQKPVAYSDENGAPCQATSKTEPPATRIEAIPPESRAGNGSW